MSERRRPWRQTRIAAAVFVVAVAVSEVVAYYRASQVGTGPMPVPPDRVETCRAAARAAGWPSPTTPHGEALRQALGPGLVSVLRTWEGHCSVITVRQHPDGTIREMVVHTATGGEQHRQALLRIASNHQRLPAPPTQVEADLIFAMGRFPYGE